MYPPNIRPPVAQHFVARLLILVIPTTDGSKRGMFLPSTSPRSSNWGDLWGAGFDFAYLVEHGFGIWYRVVRGSDEPNVPVKFIYQISTKVMNQPGSTNTNNSHFQLQFL